MNRREREEQFCVGKKVKLVCDGEADEYGIIIHTWFNDEIDGIDCNVAFYGESFPDKNLELQATPYFLRYAAVSLQIVND